MSPRLRGPSDDNEPEKQAPGPEGILKSMGSPGIEASSLASTVQPPLSSRSLAQESLTLFAGPANATSAMPIHIPPSLMDVFRGLKADPVLVGGSAVQVWAKRKDGVFLTYDLDFITYLQLRDLSTAGLPLEESGRHALVEGVAIEFPSGPLGVGDLILDPNKDTLFAPTTCGDRVRCLRPEACVLDRLAQVAGWQVSAAYLQAMGIVVAQYGSSDWDQAWIDEHAAQANLGRQWENLKADLENPSPLGLEKAIGLGWDTDRRHC